LVGDPGKAENVAIPLVEGSMDSVKKILKHWSY